MADWRPRQFFADDEAVHESDACPLISLWKNLIPRDLAASKYF